jgi:hypothetical protein
MRRFRTVLASMALVLVGLPPVSLVSPSVAVAAPSCQTVTLSTRWDSEPIGVSGFTVRQTTYFQVGVFTMNGHDYSICYSPTLKQYNVNTGLQDYYIKGISWTITRRASDNALQITMDGWAQGTLDAYWVTQKMTVVDFAASEYNYIYDHGHQAVACRWRFLSQSTFHSCGQSATTSVGIPF